MAFQALAVIGAQTAAAVVVCSFASGVITVNTDPGDTVTVQQNTVSGLIEVNGAATCAPVAPIATTTAIQINGDTGAETAVIDMFDTAGATIDWGTVDWTITMGSQGAATNDAIVVDNSGGDAAVKVTMGASGIDLNTDGNLDVTDSGSEVFVFVGGPGKDTLSAAGDSTTGAAFGSPVILVGNANDDILKGGAGNDSGAIGAIVGGAGDDTLSGGLGDDLLSCGGNAGDTVSFAQSATAVNVNLGTGNATGQGLDTVAGCPNIIGSPQADTLTGDGLANTITPGALDDKVDGAVGVDTADYSDATAAVTVDLTAGTATGGSGNDTLKNMENATGSAFNDTVKGDTGDNILKGGGGNDVLSGDKGTNTLEGGTGVDTADYAWSADPVVLVLNCTVTPGTGTTTGTVDTIKTMENANLTTGDDTFVGNEFANTVFPNGGQNSLNGDCVAGGPGGGDSLNYSVGYTTGVTVNMAGGATAGDSALNFENAIATAFNDFITGNAASNTLQGGKGSDSLRGGAGDDTLRGAAGADNVRGGSGDDDMFGGPGKKDVGFGGSGQDLCKGFEKKKGCELG